MPSPLLLAALPVASPESPAAPAAADGPAISPLQAEYAARLAQAGGDATAQVRLALWCEEQGLTPERLKHLTLAVLIAPGNLLARGLLGMVECQGRGRFRWAATAELQGGGKQAAALAEYNARRDGLAERAAVVGTRTQALKKKRQFVSAQAYLARETRVLAMERDKLGSWCREAGLDPEATAEFATAVHLDPEFDDAWRHMGSVRHNGRWMSPEQVAAAVAEAKAQAAADHHWEPLLQRWRSWLREPRRKTDAAERLGEVTDPRAAAAVGRVFLTPSPDEQAWAVRLLGAIDAVTSTSMLARVAVYSDFEPVR